AGQGLDDCLLYGRPVTLGEALSENRAAALGHQLTLFRCPARPVAVLHPERFAAQLGQIRLDLKRVLNWKRRRQTLRPGFETGGHGLLRKAFHEGWGRHHKRLHPALNGAGDLGQTRCLPECKKMSVLLSENYLVLFPKKAHFHD
ncbi:MAG: hypothetical protein ACK55I_04395, partial [bacterium]